MKNIIHGDIITLAKAGCFDGIIHGCNCMCNFGAGLAKQIKLHFPEAYKADLETKKYDKNKLGTYSLAWVDDLKIINAYTQYNYGGGKRNADYNAIRKVFRKIAEDFPTGFRLAYPQIGAGLAKGDWSIISEIIDEELINHNHTLILYKR